MVFSLAGGAVAGGLIAVSDPRKSSSDAARAPRPFGKQSAMAEASFEQWQSQVGSLFFASTEAGPMAIRLVSVVSLPIIGTRPSALRKQPFEAHFETEGSASLPAGDRLYPVRHAGHGTFNLYFSAAGKTLKALFN
jgi:hypothetical protein